MTMTTDDLYRLASDLADEHGPRACDYASRAVMTMEAEGNHDRARFWFVMLVLLGDVLSSAYSQAQLRLGNYAPDTVSVGDLFAGALIPGLVLVALYMAYLVLKGVLEPESMPPLR
jgi:hypothetical protein